MAHLVLVALLAGREHPQVAFLQAGLVDAPTVLLKLQSQLVDEPQHQAAALPAL
ncbi:hypothetical protein GCM10009599_16150 [Luteococcus peritonei]